MNKVITIVETSGIPEGSVLQNCVELTTDDGEKCWGGLWCSRYGSYYEVVPQEDCELWNEQKHDPFSFYLKQHFAEKQAKQAKQEEAEERATLARLKLKYEGVL